MQKNLFFLVHKYLGLCIGLLITVISLAGCLYAFSDELKDYFYHDRLYIEALKQAPLPISELKAKVQEALGEGKKISRVETYTDPDRTWVFRSLQVDPEGFGHWNYYQYYYRIYINPYTGEIVKIEDAKNEFFQLVLSLHMRLLLGEKYGKPILDIVVCSFLLLLLSGLYLWWPKKWIIKILKNHVLIKKGTKFKRFNYDLHQVLGFYAAWPLLITVLTGCLWSFKNTADGLYTFLEGKELKAYVSSNVKVINPSDSGKEMLLDQSFDLVKHQYHQASAYTIRLPLQEKATIDINAQRKKGRNANFSRNYFDQYTGKWLGREETGKLGKGTYLKAINFDLHTGSWLGWPGRIITFLGALIASSLPVTGFLIWRNRKPSGTRRK